jgi:hypothetical protein
MHRPFPLKPLGTTLSGGFSGVQVASRVVQAQALGRVFFHQQEAALLLYDSGYGDAGFP